MSRIGPQGRKPVLLLDHPQCVAEKHGFFCGIRGFSTSAQAKPNLGRWPATTVCGTHVPSPMANVHRCWVSTAWPVDAVRWRAVPSRALIGRPQDRIFVLPAICCSTAKPGRDRGQTGPRVAAGGRATLDIFDNQNDRPYLAPGSVHGALLSARRAPGLLPRPNASNWCRCHP